MDPPTAVVIEGWRDGASAVSAIDTLRTIGQLSLPDAKSLIDQTLAGASVVIEVGGRDRAKNLWEALQEVGFKARTGEGGLPYRRLDREPDLITEVRFLEPSDGGRHHPVASGYRPDHDFGHPEGLNGGQHEYPSAEWVHPGEQTTALVWLIAPELQNGRLSPGDPFQVHEGHAVVARGRILEIRNPRIRRAT